MLKLTRYLVINYSITLLV